MRGKVVSFVFGSGSGLKLVRTRAEERLDEKEHVRNLYESLDAKLEEILETAVATPETTEIPEAPVLPSVPSPQVSKPNPPLISFGEVCRRTEKLRQQAAARKKKRALRLKFSKPHIPFSETTWEPRRPKFRDPLIFNGADDLRSVYLSDLWRPELHLKEYLFQPKVTAPTDPNDMWLMGKEVTVATRMKEGFEIMQASYQ